MIDYATMPAGREVDMLVAENVMGWPHTDRRDEIETHWWTNGVFSQREIWSPSTDILAALRAEHRVCQLAYCNGKIVDYRFRNEEGSGHQGCCLRESYVLTLLRLVAPHMDEFEKTCMGENNWIRFGSKGLRSDDLLALASASPLHRCRAMLLTVTAPDREAKAQ